MKLDLIRVAVCPDSVFEYRLIYRDGNATGMIGVYGYDEDWYYLYKKDTEKYKVKRRKELEGIKPSFTYKQQRSSVGKRHKARPLEKNAAEKAYPMKVDVKITSIRRTGSILAEATVKLNSCFVVRNIKIIASSQGLLAAMPSCKTEDGGYADICCSITEAFRQQFNDAVIQAYQFALSKNQCEVPLQNAPESDFPENIFIMRME